MFRDGHTLFHRCVADLPRGASPFRLIEAYALYLLFVCWIFLLDAQAAGGADLCTRTLLMDLDGVLIILRIQSLVYFRLERP